MNLAKKIDTPIFHLLQRVADKLGIECYVIGGYVRDLILKRPSKDIDIVVVGSGIAMAKAVARELGKGTSLSVFQTFGTAQVKNKEKEIEIEFVGARKESYNKDSRNPIVENGTLEDDQNRRDFTVNALAIRLNEIAFGEVIDPFDGLEDMRDMILRTPLDPDITFSDDPLRMLRAIRFATQLQFDIDDETFDAIIRNRKRIEIITQERIIDEINKIMLSKQPSIGFRLLEASGLLEIIIPEIDQLKGVDKRNGITHKDIFLHTLRVLDTVAEKSDDLWLRWSALLHDIGKPQSKQWDEESGWTFRNHNWFGQKIVPTLFKRLKLPQGENMRFVQKMVDLHMRPIALSEEIVTDSAVRRLLFDAGDDIDSLMLLCESDITSNNKEKVKQFLDNFELVRKKLIEVEEKDRIRNFQPPVDGHEIMHIFNINPCSIIGEMKEIIKNAILDGEIGNNHEEALQLLYKLAEENGLKPVNPPLDEKT
ncbi:MAG: HD domain-containing protein [Bacteroidales bacterium]|nr:CCA tRNA nucleotidyltransferase [Bacteroidales bacterium]MDD5974630.1 HD domain-containing protein [Bacteroidales bacterium]MDY5194054.1 HD domain-containing protein [Candidatus Aphodosoma sp.]